ncbi:zinc-dependent peptidase [Methylobacter sp. BBA5.1]|uniref:M90 family metallopeptidase n=1 Tax=Methylobacter sp. BBA5.1 TaxID=1495064 RepID=UPI00055D2E34|nr:M90 family metallopeptidase [Methylobacter sp. BBA5.1]
MNIFRRAWVRYVLRRYPIGHDLWENATDRLPVLRGLSSVEKAHLRELSTLFRYEKNIIGAQGFEVTETMRVQVAATACLPVLYLGARLFSPWREVVIYAGAFRVSRDEIDGMGIVHHQDRVLSGESWERGPVILSWQDIEQDNRAGYQGHNVIIHEIAHKLDMLDGSANGMPPLHAAMPVPPWTDAFSRAYDELNRRLEHDHPVCVDPYAATSPAEFFAVFSEYFFCAPDIVQTHFSDVFRQLRLYYRQDPLSRLRADETAAQPMQEAAVR